MCSADNPFHSKVRKRSCARSCRVATDHSGMSLRTHFQPGTHVPRDSTTRSHFRQVAQDGVQDPAAFVRVRAMATEAIHEGE